MSDVRIVPLGPSPQYVEALRMAIQPNPNANPIEEIFATLWACEAGQNGLRWALSVYCMRHRIEMPEGIK